MTVLTSTNIPFHVMLDALLPFSPSATMEFASCHLAKMTSVEFLDEWAKLYSMSPTPRLRRGESIHFDPPMHGILFAALAKCGDTTAINLRSTGEDAVGAFDLQGKLAPSTEIILLRKTCSGGYHSCGLV